MASESILPAPQILALTYTPADIRERFRWLLLFDQRLGEVLERAREPMIAQMRLAWWRDTLTKLADERPKGEPLLAQLAELDAGNLARAAIALIDAWELAVGEGSANAASQRADAVFLTFAQWADCSLEEQEMAKALGRSWVGAYADGLTSPSRKLRPLSILSLAAQLERKRGKGNGLRLSWHALTGR